MRTVVSRISFLAVGFVGGELGHLIDESLPVAEPLGSRDQSAPDRLRAGEAGGLEFS